MRLDRDPFAASKGSGYYPLSILEKFEKRWSPSFKPTFEIRSACTVHIRAVDPPKGTTVAGHKSHHRYLALGEQFLDYTTMLLTVISWGYFKMPSLNTSLKSFRVKIEVYIVNTGMLNFSTQPNRSPVFLQSRAEVFPDFFPGRVV